MGNLALSVVDLGKKYHIGRRREKYMTLRDSLNTAMLAPWRRVAGLIQGQSASAGDLTQEIWALRDINFEVQHGEVLGIIGRNGAGKSTLLKILSRITKPTTGYAEVNGRIGSLLEVGTGFHEELTGRENIYLNGAILGMSRHEINRKFDEMVSFAGVETFIDTPVKHYSSGMKLRLGFSVAAHLEPDILVVDEVLAVGDAEFQKKCLGKMQDVAGEGRTVLFVSHNMPMVEKICQRVLCLAEGTIIINDLPHITISQYLRSATDTNLEQQWADVNEAPGNNAVRLKKVKIYSNQSNQSHFIDVTMPLIFEFEYWNLNGGIRLNLSVVLYTEDGYPAFNTIPIKEPNWHGKPFPKGLFRSRFYVPAHLLNAGFYTIALYVIENEARSIYQNENLLTFRVNDSSLARSNWHGKWIGAVRPALVWETALLTDDS